MNRRKVVMHTGMSVLLLAAGVEASRAAATATFPSPDPTPTPSGRPTTAVVGTVIATANLNAPQTVGVTFSGSPGIVTAVPVKIGDHVRKGQPLAASDDRAARHALQEAEAGVASAKGDLLDALSSVRSTRAAVAQAQQALCNARLAVHQARATLRLDAATQADAVHAAELKVYAARRDVTRTASSARTATRATVHPLIPPAAAATTDIRVANRNRNIVASTSRSSVATALSDLSAAARTRATTLLADAQQVRTLIGQAQLAARDLDAAAAAVPSDPSGTQFGPTERAQAGLKQARVEVRKAKADLDDTVLRAPFDGTVLDIAGGVGETPAAAARGSVATSSNPAGNGVVEGRNAATASGFVVLADLTHRAVTARVDEEHIGQVKVGQPAVVTFPATGTVVTGTVSSVALQETVAEHVVYYNVDIDLDDRAATQKLGQTASVVITTGGAQPSGLQVPNAAYSRVGGKTIVSVLRQGRLMRMPVTLGVIGARESQISSPLLHPDDLVVVPVTGNRQGRL
jgi:multidrug efflux pump subunit AcrA (membrane-fusion protein)